jgi:hypothetical protein
MGAELVHVYGVSVAKRPDTTVGIAVGGTPAGRVDRAV